MPIISKTPTKAYHASLSNKLLNSCYSLSTIEKRIVLLTLSKLNSSKTLSSTEWYSMNINEYAELCGVSKKDAYDNLREAVETLFTRTITEIEGKRRRDFRWIQGREVDVEAEEVRILWSSPILPYISDLERDFSKLFMLDVLKITGTYASRLYDLLYQEKWRGLTGSKEIDLDTLYAMWEVPESYKEFKEFKRSVLTPAVKELEKKELVEVTVEIAGKVGRKVKSLRLKYNFPVVNEETVEDKQIKRYGKVLETK